MAWAGAGGSHNKNSKHGIVIAASTQACIAVCPHAITLPFHPAPSTCRRQLATTSHGWCVWPDPPALRAFSPSSYPNFAPAI
ncbi:hypothetical protein M3J09_007253 [Ascochyta lentis]